MIIKNIIENLSIDPRLIALEIFKATMEQLKLLKELYKFWDFNFLKVAYLRECEEIQWDFISGVFKRSVKNKKEKTKSILNYMKTKYKRLKKYDILKIANKNYNLKV